MTTEDKLLGKQVEYPQHYCPAILVAGSPGGKTGKSMA